MCLSMSLLSRLLLQSIVVCPSFSGLHLDLTIFLNMLLIWVIVEYLLPIVSGWWGRLLRDISDQLHFVLFVLMQLIPIELSI